jgi:hypothetical protein
VEVDILEDLDCYNFKLKIGPMLPVGTMRSPQMGMPTGINAKMLPS